MKSVSSRDKYLEMTGFDADISTEAALRSSGAAPDRITGGING
jgi:hypothetical protein